MRFIFKTSATMKDYNKVYNGNLERKDITRYTKAIGKYFTEI